MVSMSVCGLLWEQKAGYKKLTTAMAREGLEHEVLILGLPQNVDQERVSKLQAVCQNRFRDHAEKLDLEYDAQKTPLIIPYAGSIGVVRTDSVVAAEAFAQNFAKVLLDKKHTLRAIPMTKAIQYVKMAEDAEVAAETKALKRLADAELIDRTDARDWLKDEGQREMFLMRAGKDLQIFFFDSAINEPVLQCDGESAREEKKRRIGGDGADLAWTNGEAVWSPQGSYLCTQHTQGYRLWLGPKFKAYARLPHRNVTDILFSPNEEYVVSYNGSTDPDCSFAVCVFSVVTGSVIKSFPPSAEGPNGDGAWPLVAWSHDSKYLATTTGKHIVVFEMETLKELSLTELIPASSQFAWQPNKNPDEAAVLAVWSPAPNLDNPCRLTVLQVPTKKVLTSKNLFAENGHGQIYWHPQGDYVALVSKVSRRLIGKKKVTQTQIEVIRMREKSLPVDSITSPHDILNFFWVPNKDRFAVLMKNKELWFFALNHRGCEHACTIDVGSEINLVKWSPQGTHLVMAGVSTIDGSGNLHFAQCIENEANKSYKVEIMERDEVPRLTDISWDPSGRFVLSSVTAPIGSETSYRTAGLSCYVIWSFQGRPLYRENREGIHIVSWRPHPPKYLTEKEKEEIRLHMKEYSKQLDAVDNVKKSQRRAEMQAKRDAIAGQFQERIKAVNEWFKAQPQYKEWQEAATEHAPPVEEVVVENEEVLSVVTRPTGIGARA
eukprot:Blabericola_migrator_1__8520@NODE_444_length_8414_cov_167_650533_g92_i1_p1_GENE_NODE_444_length_8414_cov_167_650533_g92_i1NODE_444_length_8414_cov_167_650533_g92_i1_p1_ORF_typecomplete_len718_score129_73eIF2A/PF08662_11/0_00091eIF2A/PF08662_11/11eIF2A/PF08662_11/7_8e35ANAPC4_WD40/PF12894_7/3e02ANAPC4_WD40/PF12894_7/67ANAPC4_WD40/PF12894_7/1_8ANAPC4_WD40/PF12894_7/2e03ANAPC4_WD40/PF12894_7/0_0027ANAPC4_WD40/PF12894_7/49ANAPC4_WD40/PF12894_7/3_5e03WD40/PF00400_32/2e02WD40/PF00400_32/2_8WD40/PF0040